MNDLTEQLVEYYKKLNDINDDSQDDMLKLLFGAAIEIAKKKACEWNEWNDISALPPAILLGLMELIKLMQARSDISAEGVKSESIGGMSQTFFDIEWLSDDRYFAPAYDLFGLYCKPKNALVFQKARRGRC